MHYLQVQHSTALNTIEEGTSLETAVLAVLKRTLGQIQQDSSYFAPRE